MLDFKPFTSQAMAEMKPLLEMQPYRTCDYSVGGLYMWREYFKQQYAVRDGMLFCTADYLDNGVCFSMPVGKGDIRTALNAVRVHCIETGMPMKFCCVTDEGLSVLKEHLGSECEVIEYRDWADYLYPYENFLGYHGKKLVTPRNHCNRFAREFPNYEYHPIHGSLVEKAKAFLLENAEGFEKNAPIAREEYKRAIEITDHFNEFSFSGGLLSVDGKTVGLSMGETIGDTLYVHIEKALREYSGAYPMLAMLYAKQNAADGLLYINREDDSGDPGLRKSKLEYKPCALLTKYVVCFK